MKPIREIVAKIYSGYEKTLSQLQSPLLLALRLYSGWQVFQAGFGDLINIEKVTEHFSTLGIPVPFFNAYLVGSLECIGGALLFLGLGSKIIALPLTFNMLVANIMADHETIFSVFSDPGKFYDADPFTLVFAALLTLIFGSGKISLDSAISYLREVRSEHQDESELSQFGLPWRQQIRRLKACERQHTGVGDPIVDIATEARKESSR